MPAGSAKGVLGVSPFKEGATCRQSVEDGRLHPNGLKGGGVRGKVGAYVRAHIIGNWKTENVVWFHLVYFWVPAQNRHLEQKILNYPSTSSQDWVLIRSESAKLEA